MNKPDEISNEELEALEHGECRQCAMLATRVRHNRETLRSLLSSLGKSIGLVNDLADMLRLRDAETHTPPRTTERPS